MSKVGITRLEGPLWVAYRRSGGEYHATALQFDLVGIGRTKAAALKELQDVFVSYVESILEKPGKVQFLFPSDPKEWNSADIEYFDVLVVLEQSKNVQSLPPRTRIAALRPLRRRIQGFQFEPVGSAV